MQGKRVVVLTGAGISAESGIRTFRDNDGLWENNRTDEEQLGATYSELEWAMGYDGEKNISAEKRRVLEVYYELHNKNMHKMVPIPVCSMEKFK